MLSSKLPKQNEIVMNINKGIQGRTSSMATFLSLEWFVANALLVKIPDRLRADQKENGIVELTPETKSQLSSGDA